MQDPLEEQLEGGVGRLVLVAAVLQLLEGLEEPAHALGARLHLQAHLAGLHHDAGAPGHVGDEHAGAVADLGGIDVLVAPGDLVGGVRMHPALVGEGAGPHEGGPQVRPLVRHVVDVEGKVAELREVFPAGEGIALLEDEVRQDGSEVGVAVALAVAVHGPLHLDGPRPHRGETHGHAESTVIVGVHAETKARETLPDHPDDFLHLVDLGAPVRIAEDEVGGPVLGGRPQGGEGVLRVVAVPVEEVLGVVEDLAVGGGEEADRVADHGEVLLAGGPDDLLDVEKPGLAEDGDHRGARLEESGQLGILGRGDPAPPGGPEGGQPGVPEPQAGRLPEEGEVARARAGPAGLDVVDPEVVELLHDPEFRVHREGDALPLGPVPQGRVVDGQVVRGGFHEDRHPAPHR